MRRLTQQFGSTASTQFAAPDGVVEGPILADTGQVVQAAAITLGKSAVDARLLVYGSASSDICASIDR